MKIVPANKASISEGAQILRGGGLVAFPTETVYGLGSNALDDNAVRRVFEAKGRPPDNPLIVHLSSIEDIHRAVAPLSEQTSARLKRVQHFWPGPLTIVLPAQRTISRLVTAGQDTVGVRIPNHPVALQLLREAEVPIAAPSANPSSYVSPTTAQHVGDGLHGKVDLILDGGSCAVGIESTVLSLVDEPTVLRPGGISEERISEALGERVRTHSDPGSSVKRSPGLLELHYSPHTLTRLRGSVPVGTFPKRTGLIEFRPSTPEFDYQVVRTLSKEGALEEVAKNLYATLRELDAQDLQLIVIDSCTEEGLGRAIMDRVRRIVARKG